jgi:hypothetical protein
MLVLSVAVLHIVEDEFVITNLQRISAPHHRVIIYSHAVPHETAPLKTGFWPPLRHDGETSLAGTDRSKRYTRAFGTSRSHVACNDPSCDDCTKCAYLLMEASLWWDTRVRCPQPDSGRARRTVLQAFWTGGCSVACSGNRSTAQAQFCRSCSEALRIALFASHWGCTDWHADFGCEAPFSTSRRALLNVDGFQSSAVLLYMHRAVCCNCTCCHETRLVWKHTAA